MTEVYLYFYQATVQTFVQFKQFLQREDPIISLVDQQIQSFLTKLAGKFLTIHTIKAAKSDMTKRKFDTSVHLPDKSIFVGMTTKTQLPKLFAEGDITHAQYSKFFQGVREFYVKAMGYALSNMPMNDEVLTNAKFVNVMSRDEASLAQVEYFVERFSNLLPYSSPQEHDKLGEQLIEYQLLDDSEMPESVWKSATIQEDESVTYCRMDVIWHYLVNLKAVDDLAAIQKLPNLFSLYLIPMQKRREFFSMVPKNKTVF